MSFAINATPSHGAASHLRYTFKTVSQTIRNIIPALLLTFIAAGLALADDATFHRIEVPDAKGHLIKATLTFNDGNKTVEIRPVKGAAVTIPYAQIDKCSYEFTKKNRVNEGTIATAPVGIGAVMMLTKSKNHWLQIDYHDQDMPHEYVLRMQKKEYIPILDAMKNHAGIDTEILGNADKRSR
jgi:hypothetical protein